MPENFLTDVREWLWAADALVMPSRAEGFSIALLEGIASGLPAPEGKTGGRAPRPHGVAHTFCR